jgi:photosystem II stability/assembly factor-like uncharacterized protein
VIEMRVSSVNSGLRFSGVFLILILLLLPSAMGTILTVSGQLYEPMQVSETTWELLESDYPDGSFWDVSFINSTHGWIVGAENSTFSSDLVILHSSNGGDTWQLQYSDVFGFGSAIDVVDEQTVWVTGSYGNLFYTTDGGNSWNECDVAGAIGGMGTVKFINKTNGWTTSNKVLYWTEDSGQSWGIIDGWNFNDTVVMMQVLSPLDIWAVGFGGTYHSTDGGETWAMTCYRGGWALSFVSELEGWVIDDNRLAHTTNGDTWEELVVPMRAPLFRLRAPYTTDIQFIDELNGWIVGEEIAVMYTPDGGANWYDQSVPSGVGSRMRAVDFVNGTYGWAVGAGGIILRTRIGNTLGVRLWRGLTDPMFIAIVSAIVIVPLSVVGIIKLRHRKWKLTSTETN